MKFGVYAALLASAVIAKRGQQKFELQEKKEQLLKQLDEIETLINLADVEEAKAILVEDAQTTTPVEEVTAPENPVTDTTTSAETTPTKSGPNKLLLTFEIAVGLGIAGVIYKFLRRRHIHLKFEGGEQTDDIYCKFINQELGA